MRVLKSMTMQRKKKGIKVLIQNLFVVSFFCGWIGVYANPISPPRIQKINPPTVSAPEVTAPTISTPQSSNSASSSSANKDASSAKTSGTSSKSVSALSLLGLDYNSSVLSMLNGLDGTSSTKTEDSALLTQILEKLENKANTSEKATEVSSAPVYTEGTELLRFSVNGYSLLNTIATLISSKPSQDGSFLLTGDRALYSNGQTYFETFYFLVRPKKDGSWLLSLDLSQYPANKSSFLYQFLEHAPVRGTKVGDLLVFKINQPNFVLDMTIKAGTD